ncbi:uncharacterized protein LOC132950325 [Metopolophium dirhodum]|uniref:uncharacterized protein LOC132950325 n=1 Tax=Metopolophium dirhodum TaxID=44670 RepID=UPI0029906E98|nr:uncharacterized protein LOC132950325 [Metopolophium dirhodum]
MENNSVVDRKNVNFDDWAAFEFYLERKGVVSAITNALYCLFNENPLPKNVNQFIFCILGGDTEREIKRQLKKLKRKIETTSREIETVTEEIEHLLLIRDNGLKFSVYRDFVDRKRLEK